MFHPVPGPSQQDIDQVVKRTSKRILRFLQRRGIITLQTAPGDGEVTVVSDETIGERDPLLARLLAAATAGAPPAGWANKRKPVRIVLDSDDRPVTKGTLSSQDPLQTLRRHPESPRRPRGGTSAAIPARGGRVL